MAASLPGGAGPAVGGGVLPAPVLSTRDLHYAYHGHRAVRGISLNIRQGEFVTLMGRNGSGKSTLLKAFVGLLKPDEGQVMVAGLDTRQVDVDAIIQHAGYVPQHPGSLLFSETLAAELAFTRKSHGMPQDPEGDIALLARLGLAELSDRDPRDLSGGEQQRAALAAILVAEPQIILLDEPTRPGLHAETEPGGVVAGHEARGPDRRHGDARCRTGSGVRRSCRRMGAGQVVVDDPRVK